MKTWGVSESLKLYNIENWGSQYFNINPGGNLTVHPKQGLGPGIDIMQVISDIRERGMNMPVLIRFQDIIRHRVVELNENFKTVIKEAKYGGTYRGVYPIKVNQMREVVEEILDAGQAYDYGLEAGSKAELAAVLALDVKEDALFICNGYKDYDFIKAAMMACKLGKNCIVVIEKLSELEQVIEVAREMGVTPSVGLRTKLSTRGEGKWESSGGDTAKFGLTAPELLRAVQTLRDHGLEDSLNLLHFHIGSQVTNIRTIKDAVKEATRVYSKLRKMGLDKLSYLDVGGGLGVDYDGSRTNFDSSINYSLEEYVEAVVYTIQEICEAEEVPDPTIVSESGRAIVAHHSILVVDVFGSIDVGSHEPDEVDPSENENDVVKEMRYLLQNLSSKNLLEHYHDAVQSREEALSMFKLGILSLEDRAKIEQLFWKICRRIYKFARNLKYIPEEIEGLVKYLAHQYMCNFSVFQSMPDHWAIQHLFPIVPLHRLTEEPTHESTLVDITCDSDGKVSKFIDLRDIRDTLRVHDLKPHEPYYLGIFLMGAYQDIMGDLHNLFGRVNEVHVFLDHEEPGGYYIEEVIPGNRVCDVLDWIQYSSGYLRKEVKQQIDDRVRKGGMKPREGVDLQMFYERLLNGYSYIQFDYSRGEAKAEADAATGGPRVAPSPAAPISARGASND